MPTEPARPHPPSDGQDATDLLRQLIESPLPPSHGWQAPVALRSKDEQKRHALRRYMLRTWLDGALQHAERILAVAALIVFGAWLLDGPVRDWMYERSAPAGSVASAAADPAAPTAPLAIAPVQPQDPSGGSGAAARLLENVPLPYVTDQQSAAPDPWPTAAAPQDALLATKVVRTPSRLMIPAIDLDTGVREVFVVDGAWEVAEYAAGFLNGTSLPDERGNTVLAGHAGIRGAVFRDLSALKSGDEIVLEAGGTRYRYAVRAMQAVWPTQVEVLDSTATATLTLITCTNWDTQRLVVTADLLDTQPLDAP